jgi:DNA-binding response OmpR family regulator
MSTKPSTDILLLDSNLGSRTLLSSELRQHGLKVLAVTTTAHAIEQFAKRRYDAVLMVGSAFDQDCWSLIRLFRSGRCGFAQTPVFVAAIEQDFDCLLPHLDRSTHLLRSDATESLVSQLLSALEQRPKPSILVVEDEERAARAAELLLSKFFRVEWAGDGPTALTAWSARRHDLIVLDLMLPGMSGREVLQAIRRVDREQPVLVLTSLDSPDHHRELVLDGADDYLVKTPDLFQLATHCDSLLFARSLRRSVRAAHSKVSSHAAIAARIQAASQSIRRGQTTIAATHLAHAMATLGPHTEIDDDSAVL